MSNGLYCFMTNLFDKVELLCGRVYFKASLIIWYIPREISEKRVDAALIRHCFDHFKGLRDVDPPSQKYLVCEGNT